MGDATFERWPDGFVTTCGEKQAFEVGREAERARIREGAVERVLGQYDEATHEMVLTGRFDGAQQFRGKWYVPKWGCDQLDHIVDAVLGVQP